MNNQKSGNAARGPKYAIIITVTLIVIVLLASLLAMFIISTTSEPEEVDCGLVNDLSTTKNCVTRAE